MTANSIKKLDRLCLLAVVAVTMVCAAATLSRTSRQYRMIRQENALLQKRSADLSATETNLQHLRALLNDAQGEINLLNKRIPHSTEIGVLLKQIYGLISGNGIELIQIEPMESIAERLYTKIPIRLEMKGAFVDLYRLLRDLENMNRMLVLEKMEVIRPVNDANCRVTLTASVFERSEALMEKLSKLI